MNLKHTSGTFRASRRHGAAYVLVLSTGVLLSVIGMGILASSRGATRASAVAGDIAEATILAESAVEQGLVAIQNDSAWRSTYTNNVQSPFITFGRGKIAFKLVDELDGNLANNTSDKVRLKGIGVCGSATRVYSVEMTGSGPSLEILKKPIHTGGNLTVMSNVTATGGALSSNGTLTVNSGVTVAGDVEGVSLSGAGTVTGTKTTVQAREMPNASTVDAFTAQATTILLANIPSSTIQKKVLSAASNPYGATNAAGIYYVKVPPTGILTVKLSRIKATLIVDMEAGGKFITQGPLAWESPRAGMPSLIIRGKTGCTVTLANSTTALTESGQGVNFNPEGTPSSGGGADNDTLDSYTSEFRGLLHVAGTGFTTAFSTNFNLFGAAIVEGVATTGMGVKLTADPALFATPPSGYTSASNMVITPASWKWEAAD